VPYDAPIVDLDVRVRLSHWTRAPSTPGPSSPAARRTCLMRLVTAPSRSRTAAPDLVHELFLAHESLTVAHQVHQHQKACGSKGTITPSVKRSSGFLHTPDRPSSSPLRADGGVW